MGDNTSVDTSLVVASKYDHEKPLFSTIARPGTHTHNAVSGNRVEPVHDPGSPFMPSEQNFAASALALYPNLLRPAFGRLFLDVTSDTVVLQRHIPADVALASDASTQSRSPQGRSPVPAAMGSSRVIHNSFTQVATDNRCAHQPVSLARYWSQCCPSLVCH